jgi:hypothetical protein
MAPRDIASGAKRPTRRRSKLASAAALLASAPHAEAAPATSDYTGPDADLIRLCAEHIANFQASNAPASDLASKDDARWDAYDRTRDAISNAKPHTVVGVVAKAHAAKVEARQPDGTEEPNAGHGAEWAWDVVNDLLRLHGKA